MSETFYKKVGRRYKPVYEYDPIFAEGLPLGSHLIHVRPNGQSYRYHVDPETAAMTAASIHAKEILVTALNKAVSLKPKSNPITEEQREAWNKFINVMGEDGRVLLGVSMDDIAEEAVKALQSETEKLLNNPTVRKSYDHFMTVTKLSKEA
ncbi:hypothetical protein EB118_17080 [bacterium]|nr:hypothetical protein [bacterium]